MQALASFVIVQHVLILRCMYIIMSVTLGPWGLPSDVIRKRHARVAWLHGLCPRACRVVIYMVCARIAWLHGLRDGQRPPQGAGTISSAKTHVPHVGT